MYISTCLLSVTPSVSSLEANSSRCEYTCTSVRKGPGNSFAWFSIKILGQNEEHSKIGSATPERLLQGVSSKKV